MHGTRSTCLRKISVTIGDQSLACVHPPTARGRTPGSDAVFECRCSARGKTTSHRDLRQRVMAGAARLIATDMPSSRQLLGGLILAAIAAYLVSLPSCGEPAAPIAAVPAARPAAPATSLRTGPAPYVAGPGPSASTAASSPGSSPATSRAAPVASKYTAALAAEAGVGSEGYGPHIQRMQEAGTAEEAMVAARWISACAMNAETLAGAEKYLRPNPKAPPELVKETMEFYQDQARKCQTVTPEVAALAEPLAYKALVAGVPGAAKHYASAIKRSLTAEESQLVLAGLKRDVEQGDRSALGMLVVKGSSLGLGRVEAYAYRFASTDLDPQGFDRFPLDALFAVFGSLSEAEQAQARAQATAIVAKVRAAQRR